MKFYVIKGDLFTSPETVALVHCISSDFAMGAGIAKIFTNKGVKDNLLKTYPRNNWHNHGYCLRAKMAERTVYNLVTKDKYWHKPTYDTLTQALTDLKDCCRQDNIKNIAMPAIGCGLDRLEWSNVENIIKKIFDDTDINILVYML